MDHATLVDLDVNAGRKLVEALLSEQIDLDLALIASFEEYYYPRLVIAAKWLDEFDPLERYERFYGHSPAAAQLFSPAVLLMKTTDPFIVDALHVLGRRQSAEGSRLDSYTFGGKHLLDGYVYWAKPKLAA